MERKDLYQRESDLCRILTHPVRLHLLDELRGGEKSAGELCAGLDTTSANVSAHLAQLRKAGAVTVRREGQKLYYSVKYGRIFEAFDIMREVLMAVLSDQEALYEEMKTTYGGKRRDGAKSKS
ncbi:MAG: metalloregulator ArsR/SmtB family transcription factor [Candidatus Coatesbacteria bacterium]|nr:MAG: metalloregulator ArsR/SmtB family transcription factor [Candidatus Coatesbacteria bacterium]